MALWRRGDQYEMLRNAIRAEVQPLIRAELQPIRAEIDQLRSDMNAGFATADNKYVLGKIADISFAELANDIDTIRKSLAAAGAINMNQWFRVSIIGGLIFSSLSLFISLWANVLAHVAFH